MSDDPNTYGTHIYFGPGATREGLKTLRWTVRSKYGNRDVLAYIQWFPQWRKYAMYPNPDCVFEEVCLREIAAFCEQRTKEHRASRIRENCS